MSIESRQSSDREPTPGETPPNLDRILEAILFTGGGPLSYASARRLLRGVSESEFVEAIERINHEYRRQQRPYEVQKRDSGYVLGLRRRFRHLVERLYGSPREIRLSQAAIEILSLIAYRQPITRDEIDSIRGHDSLAVIRQLIRRGLIAVSQRDSRTAYTTTPRFLRLFGLATLDDLPKAGELQQL